MATLTDHLIKLTDHRDRALLEHALSKALIDLLPLQRVIVARVISEEGSRRWFEAVTLDAKGGGKVVDPLRVDFQMLPLLDDNRDRLRALQSYEGVEIAWAGQDGPRISYFPLFVDTLDADGGVLDIHSASPLTEEQLQTLDEVLHVFRNMHRLLAHSDRDALTGLLNRKALDATFYSAVLDELGELGNVQAASLQVAAVPGQERRHRVIPSYWLGVIRIDNFDAINDKYGHLIAEEVLLLVARIMNNTFRTYDRLYRLNGEQFVVLMRCPDEALALLPFERFRVNVERFNFSQVGRVTICAGFTHITPDDSPDTALEHAGHAVKHAQHNGRNQVSSYAELLRQGYFGDVS